jgi:heme a synthase
MTPDRIRTFQRVAAVFLGYTIVVILWGAWVRISFSGDGCGDHWPLCQGQIVPTAATGKTWVELAHRLTSSLAGVLAIGLLVYAFRVFPKGHVARRAAVAVLVLMITEGLLGAGLVLLRKVAYDQSVSRGYWTAAHLCNTFALLFACTRLVFPEGTREKLLDVPKRFALVLVMLLLVGSTGAVTALGDMLFPSESFAVGLVADFDPGAHPFLRLRVFHPLFALLTAAILLTFVGRIASSTDPRARRLAIALGGAVIAQVGAGLMTLALGAPAWLQVVHLALADAVWIGTVALAALPDEVLDA